MVAIQPAGRNEVILFMLERGTERLSVMGLTFIRHKVVGRRVPTPRLAGQFGHTAVLKRLRLLVTDGLVERSGRGRNAGWSLTEEGLIEAERWKLPTAVVKV